MRSLSRFIALAVGVSACGGGDSSGPSNRAASVTGVAGDNQSGPPNAALPIPLSFVVLASNGQPLPGATVTWSVTSGNAALNPASSTTDASGSASTIVTLGPTIGTTVVRATVGPVTQNFTLTVTDPCELDIAYTIGTSINGTLTTSDCRIDPGYYYDFYGFSLGAQQGISATMTASFDTYLELFRGAGATADFLAFNDDISSSNLNSELNAILPAGPYVIGANTAAINVTGAYTFGAAARPETIAGCEVLWTTRGVTISETIAATDCVDTLAVGPVYGDAVAIFARGGTSLNLAERSTAVNAELRLFRADETGLVQVASNNDSSGTTTNAFISYPVTTTAVYVVFIGTAETVQTGEYTFEVKTSTSPIASRSAIEWLPRLQGVPERLRMTKLELPERWKRR